MDFVLLCLVQLVKSLNYFNMALDKVFPSAGHHDNDPGAVANDFIEFLEMNRFRDKLCDYLNSKNQEFTTDYNYETNSEYQNRIKPTKSDLILDMHLDAAGPTATGCGTFISNNAGQKSKDFAKRLVDGCSEIMGIANRGVRPESMTNRKRIGILNKKGSAALIEFCFITNINDMRAFHSNEDELVKFVGDLLIEFDNLDY